jgi:cytochrome c oxidase subunit II
VSGEVPQEAAPTTTLAQEGNAEAGLAVFEEQNCGSCHTYEQAGSTGTTGPNLNESLEGKDPGYVFESIVDPDAEVAAGFQPGIMPQDYEQKLNDRQLADLVAFLLPQS